MKKGLVPTHTRYDYVPLNERKDYNWPGGKRLAVWIAPNVEVWNYDTAFGVGISPTSDQLAAPAHHFHRRTRAPGALPPCWTSRKRS